jgi:hypothetical protein
MQCKQSKAKQSKAKQSKQSKANPHAALWYLRPTWNLANLPMTQTQGCRLAVEVIPRA